MELIYSYSIVCTGLSVSGMVFIKNGFDMHLKPVQAQESICIKRVKKKGEKSLEK